MLPSARFSSALTFPAAETVTICHFFRREFSWNFT